MMLRQKIDFQKNQVPVDDKFHQPKGMPVDLSQMRSIIMEKIAKKIPVNLFNQNIQKKCRGNLMIIFYSKYQKIHFRICLFL